MSAPRHTPPSAITVHVSRKKLMLLGGLLLAPWVLLFVFFADGFQAATPRPSAPAPTAAPDGQTVACKPGPWGDLHYTRILIEPPEDQIVANFPAVDHVTWTFVHCPPPQLAALWQSAGLNPGELAIVNDPSRWQTAGDNTRRFTAPAAFVLNLTPKARTVIYSLLSEVDENPAQKEPFRFRADRESEWFEDSGLQPATIALVKKLLYRRGTSLLFSDQALLFPQINSLAERTRLVKTLARKSTMLVTLRVHPDSNIDALDNYWGRGTRSKDIKPLLQSLPDRPEGVDIDIVHLLPRLPRSLLYTYPSPNDPGSSSYLDCHWTVLNFFNATPDPKYQDINEVTKAFRTNYHPVTTPPTFGDIYLFVKPDGDVLHSCVYIADDIVFTKNGASPSSPWILMELADVIAFYPSDQPLDIQRYRARDGVIGN
jgi:hypothetical protein